MSLAAQLVAYYKSAAAYVGTIKIEQNDRGHILFRPAGWIGEAMSSLNEAQRFVQDTLGLTEFSEVMDTRGVPKGSEFFRVLGHEMQQKEAYKNLRINEEVYKFEHRHQAEEFIKRRIDAEGNIRGFHMVDGQNVRIVKFLDGRHDMGMTHQQIMDAMEETVGFRFLGTSDNPFANFFDGKAFKRAKAVYARKQIESGKIASPFLVSVEDATQRLNMSSSAFYKDELAKYTADPKAFERVLSEIFKDTGVQGDLLRAYQRGGSDKGGAVARLVEEISNREAFKGVDGLSEASSAFFWKMTKAQINMLGEIESKIPSTTGFARKQLETEARRLRENIEIIEHGRRNQQAFNVRALGLDLMGDDPVMRGILKKLEAEYGLELKGNIIYQPELDVINEARVAKGLAPIDIRTDYRNITQQGGSLLEGAIGKVFSKDRKAFDFVRRAKRRFGYGTLTPFVTHETHFDEATGMLRRVLPEDAIQRTRLDIQTASSYPEFFDHRMITAAGQEHLERYTSSMRALEEGRLTQVVMEMLEAQANDLSVDVVKRTSANNVLESIRRHSRLREIFGEGAPGFRPDALLKSQIAKVLFEGTFKEKGGIRVPSMDVPQSLRGEIVAGEIVKGGFENMKDGYIAYSKRAGTWIMKGSDAPNVYAAFGGFDFDDALNGMIRVDKEGRIRVIMTRQPNARGEWASFRMDYDDDAFTYMLSRQRQALRKSINAGDLIIDGVRAEDSLHDVSNLQRMIKQMRNASSVEEKQKIAGRIQDLMSRKGTQLFGLYDDRKMELIPRRQGWRQVTLQTDPTTGLRTYEYQGEQGLFRYMQNLEEGVAAARPKATSETLTAIAERMQAHLGKAIDDKTLLGTYSNARMFYDHFLGTNYEALKAGRLTVDPIRVLEQEQVIDAWLKVVGDDKGITSKLIRDIQENMIKAVMEMSIKAHVMGISDGGLIDPAFIPQKGRPQAKVRNAHQYFTEVHEALIKSGDFEGAQLERLRGLELNNLLMDTADERATVSAMNRVVEEIEAAYEEIRRGITFSKEMLTESRADSIRADVVASRDAKEIMRVYRESIRHHASSFGFDVREMTDVYEAIRHGDPAIVGAMDSINYDVMAKMGELFEVTTDTSGRVHHVAGERAYKAVVRLAQLIDASGEQAFGAMSAATQSGLFYRAQDWIMDPRIVDPMPLSLEWIGDDIGTSFARTGQIEDVFRQVLSSEDFETLQELDHAFSRTKGRRVRVGAELSEALTGFLSHKGQVVSPLDPHAVMMMGGSLPQPMRMVAYQYISGDTEIQKQIATSLSDAFANYVDFAASYASAADADESVANLFRGALRKRPGGEELLATAAEKSAEVVNNTYRRMSGGRAAMLLAGVAAVGFAGAGLRKATRRNDYAVDEMQGPANLPGGNPYQEQEYEPRQMFTPMTSGTTTLNAHSEGVTYEIRAHKPVTPELIEGLQALTDGRISISNLS